MREFPQCKGNAATTLTARIYYETLYKSFENARHKHGSFSDAPAENNADDCGANDGNTDIRGRAKDTVVGNGRRVGASGRVGDNDGCNLACGALQQRGVVNNQPNVGMLEK